MTSITEASLTERRQALRLQLRAQRVVIEHQLRPTRGTNTSYPRSKTMSFIRREATPTIGLLGELATVLIGPRFIKSIITAVTLARVVRLVSPKSSHGK